MEVSSSRGSRAVISRFACDCFARDLKFPVLDVTKLPNFQDFPARCENVDNNSSWDYQEQWISWLFLSEWVLLFKSIFQSDLTFIPLKVSEMDSKIEWQKSDSSKFIFHYNREWTHSTGEERKLFSIEKWMPLLPSHLLPKKYDDDECLSPSYCARLEENSDQRMWNGLIDERIKR